MEKPNFRNQSLGLLGMMAGAFGIGSSRSGGMVGLNLTPQPTGWWFHGPSTVAGRRKHAGEVRRIKQRQRHRSHLRNMRG